MPFPRDRPETPLEHARAALARVALEPLASPPPTQEDVEAGLQRLLPGAQVTAFEGPNERGEYVVSASVPLAPYLSFLFPVDLAPDATCAPLPPERDRRVDEPKAWIPLFAGCGRGSLGIGLSRQDRAEVEALYPDWRSNEIDATRWVRRENVPS